MQIVINIDENLYTRLFDNGVDNYDDAVDMAKAIRKGTPLPKGHGRLIDADSMKRIDAIQRGDFNSIESIRAWIDIMPTVIEADKEAEDETD